MTGRRENHFGRRKPAPPLPAEPAAVRRVGVSPSGTMQLPLPGRDHPPQPGCSFPPRSGGGELLDQVIEHPARWPGSGGDRGTRPGENRTGPSCDLSGSPDRMANPPGGLGHPRKGSRRAPVWTKPVPSTRSGSPAIRPLVPSEAAQEMSGRPEPARSGTKEGMRGRGRWAVHRTRPTEADKNETGRDEEENESQDPVMDPSRGSVWGAGRCGDRPGRIRIHGECPGLRSRRIRRRPSWSSALRKRCG
jgi:hypothetical protein